MTPLDDHFEHDVDAETYSFSLSTLAPACTHEELVDGLVDVMARAKSDPTVTADLLEAAGWSTAVADLRKGRIAVRRGDFAEALAAEACETVDERVVPVRKLRLQIDPEQTLPGGDVVGFVVDDGGDLDDLEFIEVKYRTEPGADIAVHAHDQLSADRETGYATTIKFLASRLSESDPGLYEAFLAYLRNRDVKQSWHTVVLSFDAAKWDDIIAEYLEDLDVHLPELWLRLFPFEDAVDLIEEVYAGLLWDVFADD